MNIITKQDIASLGYHFIAKEFLPKGKNEYYIRNAQHASNAAYRKLSASEIKTLVQNGNMADDWSKILVSGPFDPKLVRNCTFYGLIRIGKLEPCFREFKNLRMPVGISNSLIISCDIGDNVVIDNINYMSHYIIGNDVMLVNINELATTDRAKFGNGILKEGEAENLRIWVEVCNENAGRSVLPFDGLQTGDAWLWSRYRDDKVLQQRFLEFTEKKFDHKRGYYGTIGDRTVIKNCRIIKDVLVGTDAYIKGANKLKNLTVNSSAEAPSQIGEGCELVNGIIGLGCRIFYGVKAVRFVLGSNSQLKYGARLINSFLGDNSTISCCEVLNSLLFPAHEQHHNNSFLCAAAVLGQSNMAAGATIGSNHNSRGADGEMVAGRGFWPGLCVSLKHNSKFASFTIIAKGDFPAELNIPLPFSLVNNDVSRDRLVVMPGYWFLYNLYALARNESKYSARDKRTDKSIYYEYDFLAPDSVNEMFDGMELLCRLTGKALDPKATPARALANGRKTLELHPEKIGAEIAADGFENTRRKAVLVKVPEAYSVFKQFITYYGVTQLMSFISRHGIQSWTQLVKALPGTPVRKGWKNIGGQLLPEQDLQNLIRKIRTGKISGWDEVHAFYQDKSEAYPEEKFKHAFASLLEVKGLSRSAFTRPVLVALLQEALATREWMTRSIFESRAKDYDNPFRKMVYETNSEMEKVIGPLKDNSFIAQQKAETVTFRKNAAAILQWLKA